MAVGPVRLLAVESATDLVGAALLSPDGSVAERSHVGGRAHAELLAPAIEEVCALAGCTLAEVDTVAADGPAWAGRWDALTVALRPWWAAA